MKYTVTAMAMLACLIACCGGQSPAGQKKNKAANAAVQRIEPAVRYGYRIVNAYPHDTGSYTQGLFWHDGLLYESTGEYGRSAMKKVELETGVAVLSVPLAERYFGEGAALAGGKIYQLTWLEKTAFVRDPATLKETGTFSHQGEGWGLTTDGAKLYMSDGSANIAVRNPEDFRIERVINVTDAGKPVGEINELEWIDGKIWANLYITDYRQMTSPKVIIIDPATGRVEGTVDFTGIFSELAITPYTDVMNGIAHDPATGRIFVTGKRWNKLFEIEIVGTAATAAAVATATANNEKPLKYLTAWHSRKAATNK